MKKFVIGLLFGAMLMFSVNAFAKILFVESPLVLFVNGIKVEQPIYILNDRTYIPMEAVSEAANIEVDKEKISILPKMTNLEAVASKVKDSCVMIHAYKKVDGNEVISQGSGWVYGDYVVTAKHVLEKAYRVQIFAGDKSFSLTGVLTFFDSIYDIGAVKIKTGLPSVAIGDSDKLTKDERLVSITSPKGEKNLVDECVYVGVEHGKNGTQLILSETKMDSGSSGGAVFNGNGEIVGYIIEGYKEADNHYAIPINNARLFLKSLK